MLTSYQIFTMAPVIPMRDTDEMFGNKNLGADGDWDG